MSDSSSYLTFSTPEQMWARCRPHIVRAIDHRSQTSIAEVENRLAEGRAWFWPEANSAAVLQMAKECHIWLAAGSMREIVAAVPAVEDWARGQGCDRLTIQGRKGWDRVLSPLGFIPQTMLTKGL